MFENLRVHLYRASQNTPAPKNCNTTSGECLFLYIMIYKLATLVTLSLVIANANALPTGDSKCFVALLSLVSWSAWDIVNELDTREPFEEEEHVSRSIGEASQLELSTRDVVEFEAREEGMEAREFEEEGSSLLPASSFAKRGLWLSFLWNRTWSRERCPSRCSEGPRRGARERDSSPSRPPSLLTCPARRVVKSACKLSTQIVIYGNSNDM